MAKNNFKAQTASATDPNYANNIGTGAAPGVATGLGQQAQGFGNQQNVLGQQLGFAQMLQNQAAGTGGPTQAQNYLKQATAQNNANAAGAAASNKTLNPALAARTALMSQGANNQAAAGQAGQIGVQERQIAQGELGGALSGAAGTAGAQTQAGTGLLGTSGSVGNQSNANLNTGQNAANQVNAQVAQENASAINSGIGSIVNAAGGAFGLARGGEVPPPTASGHSFAAQVAHHLTHGVHAPLPPTVPARGIGMAEGGQAPTDQQVAQEGDIQKKKEEEAERERQADEEALAADAGTAKKGMAHGGETKGHYEGFSKLKGELAKKPGIDNPGAVAASIGRKKYGEHKFQEHAARGVPLNKPLKMASGGDAPDSDEFDAPPPTPSSTKMAPIFDLGGALRSGLNNLFHPAPTAEQGMAAAQGAPLPANYVPPPAMAHGGALSFLMGGGVPGHAQVPGDDEQNDTVDAKLSPGEVVLPRSISHDPEAAHAFVKHLMGGKKKKSLKDLKTEKRA